MRFIHIADIHLGASPEAGYDFAAERGEEIWDSFFRLLSEAERLKVDLLLIAGDLFHRQPLKRELKEINYRFGEMPDTQIVICAGNHDYMGEHSYYRDFEWAENVHFFKSPRLGAIYLEELNTVVYGMSYDRNKITERIFDNARPGRMLRGAVDMPRVTVDMPGKTDDTSGWNVNTFRKTDGMSGRNMNKFGKTDDMSGLNGDMIPADAIHILMAHGGDEEHIPLNLNRLRHAGFDYVALGHIHKPWVDDQVAMAYAGGIEPIDRNDEGDHGYIYGEIDEEGEIDIRFVPFAMRSYHTLTVEVQPDMTFGAIMDLVRSGIAGLGTRDMYKVVLQGFRDPTLEIDKKRLEGCGNILSVKDVTVPDFDLETLYEENKDNMIGMYIKGVTDAAVTDEVKAKALNFGLKSLLGL